MSWRTKTLRELCEIEMGGTPDRANPLYWNGQNVWVSISDISALDDKVIFASREKITDEGIRASNIYRVTPGTLLFSFKLSIGKRAIAGVELYTNEAIAALPIKDKNEIDTIFLYYALGAINWNDFGQRAVKGITLNKAILSEISIEYPPLEEQKRIVAILKEADHARRTRNYTQSLSDTFLQETFVEMFGDPSTNPMGWEIKPLQKLCTKIVDCLHATPNFAYGQTPYACIRSSDIQNGYLDWSTTKYLDKSEYETWIQRDEPKWGDVFYCREGARLGNAARINTRRKVALGQRMMMFRPKADIATSEHIWAYLEADSVKRRVWDLVGGSASPHVNIAELRTLPVPVPPLEKQQAFSHIVQEHDRVRAMQAGSEEQSEHMFQTLLYRAFRGEL